MTTGSVRVNMPKLTIGMAHYDDYDGVYFSIQALRMYHDLTDVELIVVDNSPDTAAGEGVKTLIENFAGHGNAGARYIPMPEATGTSQPRNRVFEEARGELVMCMDCHVMLWPGCVEDLIVASPFVKDQLLSGVLLYDDLHQVSTHFADEWRSEMWGTWAKSKCFDVHDLKGGQRIIEPQKLTAWGDLLKRKHAPMSIPAMGLGLFAAHRESWLGFNEHFRGFGGEEFYIHEKYRQAGRKCLCLPFLRWLHRFGRPGGVKYPLDLWSKVRNYVIGHQELDLDMSRLREHFVDSGKVSVSDWDYLLEDPIAHTSQPGSCASRHHIVHDSAGDKPPTLEQLFDQVKATPRDLDQHAAAIREYAGKCDRIVAFVKRKEWNVLLAAGRPKELIVYQTENDPLLKTAHAAVKSTSGQPNKIETYTTHFGPGADSLLAPPQTHDFDMLVIDTVHHGDRLREELERHWGGYPSYIMFRGTAAFGWKSEDGSGEGLLPAIRDFVTENPEYFIAHHATNQYGLTVLSRVEEDLPAEAIHAWPPGHGPGTELKKIFESLGIVSSENCDCNAKMAQMDIWGLDGCEQHFDTIVGWLKEGQERWGWKSKLAAAGRMVTTGLVFKVNWSDPFPGLVREAIKRA